MSDIGTSLPLTIVTIVRNDTPGLQLTLLSVREQSFQSFTHVIIDGASDDGTGQFATLLIRHGGTTIFVSEPDRGIYDAMNKGLAMTTTPWVLFMNAGDRFCSSESLRQAMLMANDDVDVVYGDVMLERDHASQRVYCDLKQRNIHHQGVIYRKSIHDDFGSYLVCRGVTISDYVFFNQIAELRWVKCDTPIAICDATGRSSKPAAYYQRLAVDLIVGNRGRLMTGLMLLAYPFYRALLRPLVRRISFRWFRAIQRSYD